MKHRSPFTRYPKMDIRDPIHGSIELSDAEVKVIDTNAYQRLRHIRQLGFAEYSFPGATHNRYLHSIGVCHLAGKAFDSIFKNFAFSNPKVSHRLRQAVRFAALLHDIGHGPLSHTTEEVMPRLKELRIDAYKFKRPEFAARANDPERAANHEDYTIKFLTDSHLTRAIEEAGTEVKPIHIACLVDKGLRDVDDFFVDAGINFRPILSQIVSSEMDCDRMDYLERDAYFCGTNYGKIEQSWILNNLTSYQIGRDLFLAVNRRALYSFDDFLLARHHMHLMVYFHHKSIIYEEILYRYLTSEDCAFFLPSDIEDYVHCTDYALYQHLASHSNRWAQRIANRKPFRVLFELHSTQPTGRVREMKERLEGQGIETIYASTSTRLSKYHSAPPEENMYKIYVVDQYDSQATPYPIEDSTEIFRKYDEIRQIERIYVSPENYERGLGIINFK